eukprot:CAMPEP_0115287478 /NCGR_PEP_ID=MMETSP0270-20121206/62481_1 /TAXON_ID=71861 /ORGANISM="Scrippsiella trochoidea, Strain CCMP3099" /LENGTH=92 /DNA_ID=CAMNT_0002704561 /DNA_START=45 /DNA_END=321 /DNA_ORIENTATION=+
MSIVTSQAEKEDVSPSGGTPPKIPGGGSTAADHAAAKPAKPGPPKLQPGPSKVNDARGSAKALVGVDNSANCSGLRQIVSPCGVSEPCSEED